jgi:hypothetical protein
MSDQNLANMLADMDPPEMAPPRTGRGDSGDIRRMIAEIVLRSAALGRATTLTELAEKRGHQTNNAIGTTTGSGVGRRNGMNLWRDRRSGDIRVCRQNVQSCAAILGADLDRFVTEELDMSADSFAVWIGELPLARVVD